MSFYCQIIRFSSLFIILSTLINCSSNDTVKPIKIEKVVGNVQLFHMGKAKILDLESMIVSGDGIQVNKGGYAEIILFDGRRLFLSAGTQIITEFINSQNGNIESYSFRILAGTIVSSTNSDANSKEGSVCTDNSSFIYGNSDFSASFLSTGKQLSLSVITGEIPLYSIAKRSVMISSCMKVIVSEDGNVGKPVSLTQNDINHMEACVGADIMENILAKSVCFSTNDFNENEAPIWEPNMKFRCYPKKTWVNKLTAKDPENDSIHYSLLQGPLGMIIGKTDGVLKYTPFNAGTFAVRVVAEDSNGNNSELSFYLTVVGKVDAVISAPKRIPVGEKFTISASRSVNMMGTNAGLSYRFDCNGDGIWDLPANASYSKQKDIIYSYDKSGEYSIVMETKDVNGKKDTTSQTIIAMNVPVIDIIVTPEFGTIGTEYRLQVVKNIKTQMIASEYLVRWDLNGDCTFDYPKDGSYSDERDITHSYEIPGIYTIKVEARDEFGQLAFADANIKMYKGINITELNGLDTVTVNQSFKITCIADDPTFKIVEYAWDFAGVGMLHDHSEKHAISVSYTNTGVYSLVCVATNEKGMNDSEVKTIVVIKNISTKIDSSQKSAKQFETIVEAGGPYITFINKRTMLDGIARDDDSKIISYGWDINSDGHDDISSDVTGKQYHCFKKAGKFKLVLTVKCDDGLMTNDTAEIKVKNRLPISFAGEDIISKSKRKVKLTGVANDPDSNIVTYEWDFDSDGIFDWKSDKLSDVEHVFTKYSEAVFKVTDSEGETAIDTLRIVICPNDMVTIKTHKYCIDRYEWPNKKRVFPVTNVTFEEAKKMCKKAGKRLCTLQEHKRSCIGERGANNYPYGRHYEPKLCNSYGNRHIGNAKAPAGEFPECVTKEGAVDMTGNVAEWVIAGDGNIRYAAGGWWQHGEGRARCGSYMPLKKDKKFSYVGFRCCK